MPNTGTSLDAYVASWHPEPVTDQDALPPGPVAAFSALLDEPGPVAAPGDPLPPLWHWFYFLHWTRQSELGADGHPLRGHLLPPIPDRRRMFAGGRCTITEPLRVGERAERISSLSDVACKRGRSGELVFVTERHEFRQGGRPRLVDEFDIVYRSGRSAADYPTTVDTTTGPPAEGAWHRTAQPDPTLLFRYSALTANGHRIHYDSPYAQRQEGYPGLVVHGPLLAALMLDLVRTNTARRVADLSFRFRSPAFAGERIAVCGSPAAGGAHLHVATHRNARHATAEVTFAE